MTVVVQFSMMEEVPASPPTVDRSSGEGEVAALIVCGTVMLWVAWWTVVAIVGACGVVASTNSVRFERRVARE
ncbi:MAG: hypothetical protein H0W08_23615, partial [Acidobacteria bacterium]|nr:hypothetical protein [Acidobacteriota bacterium]